MALNSTCVGLNRRSWMSCMWFFNTFLGLVALIVSGLIGATITFLLMHLGLPDEKAQEEGLDIHGNPLNYDNMNVLVNQLVEKYHGVQSGADYKSENED